MTCCRDCITENIGEPVETAFTIISPLEKIGVIVGS